jgi:hypothetical protein
MNKFWSIAAGGVLFMIPSILSVPIVSKGTQTYYLLYVIFRSGNKSLFDTPIEWFFWALIVIPIAFSVMFINLAVRASKTRATSAD